MFIICSRCIVFIACLVLGYCQSWGTFWTTGPKIEEISPTSGISDDTVRIRGQGFNPNIEGNTVRFNGVLATIQMASGSELVVTVPGAAKTGTISVTTPDGAATSPVVFTVKKYFVYAANTSGVSISAYELDLSTGALNPLAQSPFSTAANPMTLAMHPSGKFIYATLSSNFATAFAIASNGALSPIGIPLATGAGIQAELIIDPSGRFAYVSNGSSSISGYSIDATGILTSLGTPTLTNSNPTGLVIDPAGKFLYVAYSHVSANSVGCFMIDPINGALTPPCGETIVGANPYGLTMDPSGKYVYATLSGSNNIAAYLRNPNTGALGAIVFGAPFGAGTGPRYIRVHPSGKFVYAVNTTSANISAYNLDGASGILSAIAAPSPIGTSTETILIEPTGKYIFVPQSNASGQIARFSIDKITGALTALTPVPAGNLPKAIVIGAVAQ